MIITNCPRCGAMNATTTCTKCGWSQFTKSTVSTGARVVEWGEEMSERAEMKCKRCGDNEDRIDGFCSNECKDKYSLEEALSKMSIRIAELEKDNDEFRQLIHDWIIILTPDDGYVPDSECVRQAMLVIDKECER